MSGVTVNFKVLKGGVLLKEQSIAADAIKIGSMASSQLQIEDESISKMHAVVEVGGPDSVQIIDLGSDTGIVMNGQRVEKALISSGDSVMLGNIELQITFQVAAAAVAAPGMAPQAPGMMPQMGAPTMGVGLPGMAMAGGMAMGAGMQAGAPAPAAPAAYVDLNKYEDISKQAVEVVVMWNNSVLQVQHYTNDNPKKVEHFYVGEDFTCNFPLPAESLGGQTKVPLVVNQLGGGATVNILGGASGDVTYEDGSRVNIADLISGGQVQASSEVPGGYAMALPAKGRVKIDFGSWTFLVNAVPSPRKFVAPMTFDWTQQIYTGVSALLHVLFLFLIYFIPPSPEGLSLDQLEENNRFVKYMLTAAEVEQEEVPEWLKKEKKDEQQGGKGKRHKGEEGQMGKRDARKTDNHYGIKGPKDNPNPHMARSQVKEMAKNAGILSYLSAANAPTSPFGQDTALGVDPENALGALMGNQVGENFGYGGLGLSGTGRGGGGTGEGTIGLGNLNTIGHGGGGGSGSGYGRGAGGLGGRRGRAPQIRSGAAMVQGSLSKEVIRRIIHRHINEVKFCYERELASRPDLEGRVAIKFIISGTGAVQMAAVASSTLGNAKVENCIAQAVRRWTFPQPKGGGVVIVTYPFQLTGASE
ncbi:MAG: AgmX/PglI C-terminal domain-containing protein [Deltaproteobacteria bacterium]|nr:AgmX/PglI C-terminal domain-containing protein [Deltaproteobacteria bacterium]